MFSGGKKLRQLDLNLMSSWVFITTGFTLLFSPLFNGTSFASERLRGRIAH